MREEAVEGQGKHAANQPQACRSLKNWKERMWDARNEMNFAWKVSSWRSLSRMPHGPDPRIWCNKRLKGMQWSGRGLSRISKADSRLALKTFLLISSISGSARMKSFGEFYRRLGNTKSRFDANISGIESCWWQPKPLMLLQIKNFYHRACNEQSSLDALQCPLSPWCGERKQSETQKKSRHKCFSNLLTRCMRIPGFVKQVSSGEFAWQAKLLAFTSRSSYIESAKNFTIGMETSASWLQKTSRRDFFIAANWHWYWKITGWWHEGSRQRVDQFVVR